MGPAGGERQLAGLAEAERVHAGSGAEVEHARTLVELGAAVRGAGGRVEARDASPRAATAGWPRSRPANAASRSSPRASGRTGRSQLLFVTEKTVESHLGRAYAKLGIGSRRQLAAVLAEHDG